MADEGNQEKTLFDQHYGVLFREHRLPLVRMASRITGNYHDGEEALQNGFIKVMEVFKSADTTRRIDLTKNPIGYLHQAVHNAALDLIRTQKQRNRLYVRNAECEQIPAPETIPDLDERIPYLREALAKMKPKLVQTLNFCCVEEKTCGEVGKRLRRPRGTVLTDLARAKFQVRRLIRKEEKRYEAQKNNGQGIPRPGLADPSGA